ncbi:MAG: transketolase [Thermotogaceae bacterium]|nr:transketolase [Thermotogaceae bacterium]
MKIAIRRAIGEKIIELAKDDKNIVIVTSDARGSAAISEFFEIFPERSIEVGIAEQSAVGVAAGLALSGKKPFVFGPACFYSARSLEQIKNDVAYTNANVKIVAVSGGVSYGPLGSTHHSLHDIAVMRSISNLHVILPSDAIEAIALLEKLLSDSTPTYMRVGRNPVLVFHDQDEQKKIFEIGKAINLKKGNDLSIIATGEIVWNVMEASKMLENEGIEARVIELHTVKPLDEEEVYKAAKETGLIVTVEEHNIFGGLGGAIAEFVSQNIPVPVKILGIPDEYPVTGKQEEVLKHYGLDSKGIFVTVKNWFRKMRGGF